MPTQNKSKSEEKPEEESKSVSKDDKSSNETVKDTPTEKEETSGQLFFSTDGSEPEPPKRTHFLMSLLKSRGQVVVNQEVRANLQIKRIPVEIPMPKESQTSKRARVAIKIHPVKNKIGKIRRDLRIDRDKNSRNPRNYLMRKLS